MGRIRVCLERTAAMRWQTRASTLATLQAALGQGGAAAIQDGEEAMWRITLAAAPRPGHIPRFEYADCENRRPVTAAAVLEALAAALPPEWTPRWAKRISARAPSIRAALLGARYRAYGSFDASRAAAFENAETRPFRRYRKGREKIVDLKPFVTELRVESRWVDMTIAESAEGTPRAEEILISIFGLPWAEAMLLPIERRELWFRNASDLPTRLLE